MPHPEFPYPVRIDSLGAAPRAIAVEAGEDARTALAARFGLLALEALTAQAAVRLDGEAVIAEGRVRGTAVQACVATGQPVPATVDEPFALRFVPERGGDGAEELELEEGDLDTVAYTGGAVDLGEAVAQEFALALDPFPRCADAEAHLARAGVLTEEAAEVARQEASPFAALKALKRD